MPRKSTQTASTAQLQTPPRRAAVSLSRTSASRAQTRSMTRANAAYQQALLTPPQTIRTYRTRDRTIAVAAISFDLRAAPEVVPVLPSLSATTITTRVHLARQISQAPPQLQLNEPAKHNEEGTLAKVAEGLKLSSRCDICYQLMQRPFTVECGHSACGLCLHRHFSSILAPRLRAINCKIPTTTVEMETVVQAAWSAGILPRTLFSYICPTCRKPIKSPPVDHITLKSLITTIRGALEGRPDLLKDEMGWADESGITGTGHFSGFFLKTLP